MKQRTMKKGVKRGLIVASLVLLLAAGVALVFFYPMLGMTPAETGVVPGTKITAVRNARNAVYFIDTGEGYLLVDAGSSAEAIETALSDVGIAAQDVKWVLMTHSDYDHVAALALFPKAEVYMSEEELPLLDGREKRNGFAGNSLPDGVSTDTLTLVPKGQTLTLGGVDVQCIASPGHTIGSMSYLLEGQYLFTGDAFRLADGKMDVHPFTMEERLARESIERLAEVGSAAKLVFTGHYGYCEGSEIVA